VFSIISFPQRDKGGQPRARYPRHSRGHSTIRNESSGHQFEEPPKAIAFVIALSGHAPSAWIRQAGHVRLSRHRHRTSRWISPQPHGFASAALRVRMVAPGNSRFPHKSAAGRCPPMLRPIPPIGEFGRSRTRQNGFTYKIQDQFIARVITISVI
jgi:hypothetical protein